MKTKQININIDLFPWQSDCLQQIINNKHKIHVIKSRRQTGKSILMELVLLKFALENNNGSVYYVLPSYKQCVKIWDELIKMIENTCFVKKINNTLFQIKLVNGTEIQFFSAEQKISSLQGYTARSLLIVDEGAFISEDVYNAILPWTNTCQPTTIFISTPQFKVGTFYNFWCDGLNPDIEDVMSFDFCKYDTSALLSQSRLEYYRRTLPSMIFKQHYLGEFSDSEGSVFGDFTNCLRKGDIQPYDFVNFGIDWSTGSEQDETAITIITNNKQVLDIVHFNDKDSIQTIEYITELAKHYKPHKIIAEKNSIGSVFLDILKKTFREKGLDIPILPFITTNDSKFQIVSQLQVAIQNNEISLPDDEALKLQLMRYEMTLSKTNKPTYNAQSGSHDDMLMSMMIALDSIITKKKSTFI